MSAVQQASVQRGDICFWPKLMASYLVPQLLPPLIQLLHHNDNDILSDACWAISYLSDGDNDRIDVVLKTGIISRLVELMSHEELNVMVASSRLTVADPKIPVRADPAFPCRRQLSALSGT